MSYKRLSDEELDALLLTLESTDGIVPAQDQFHRALRELAELRQAAHVANVCSIPVLDADTLQPIDESVLEEAQRLVYGDRNISYGHPADDYGRTAQMWSAILGATVTPRQAALCMVAVKISRECHAPKRDNRVDMAGYAAVVDRIDRREAGLE